jgi:hypothetical protein
MTFITFGLRNILIRAHYKRKLAHALRVSKNLAIALALISAERNVRSVQVCNCVLFTTVESAFCSKTQHPRIPESKQ